MMYTPHDGAGPAFEIEADRHGSYTIRLNGKVVRRKTALTTYLDKPRWGSRKLEAEALADAKRAIDEHMADLARASAPPDSRVCGERTTTRSERG